MPFSFSTPDDPGEIRASELHTSLADSLGAQASEAMFSSTRAVWRGLQYAFADGDLSPSSEGASPQDVDLAQQAKASIPEVGIDDARQRVKREGLDGQLKLPDQPTIRKPVLDLMVAHARERADLNAAVSRGPSGFVPNALGFMTSVGAGFIDPVGAAAFMVPVLPEAVWASRLAKAGDGLAARASERMLQGAAQGAAGTTLLQPADWWLHTQDGQDYTMADALRSVVLGAGMGSAFHAGLGALGDVRAKAHGSPLPGTTEETLARALQPQSEIQLEGRGEALAASELGRSGAEAIGGTPGAAAEPAVGAIPLDLPPGHPAHVLADLPELAREDVYRAAAADVIAGRPVRVGEMLQEAAKADPRIAESVRPQQRGPQSLLEFIAAGGGISSKEPLLNDFLQAAGGNRSLRGIGKLVSPDGIPLDRMREAAVEAGYLDDPGRETGRVSESTIRDLLDAVDTESRGQKVYARGEEPVPTERDQREARFASSAEHLRNLEDSYQEIGRQLDQHGVTGPERADVQRRAEVIIRREDVRDPTVAVDRALDEFDIRGNRPGAGDADMADWQQFADARPEYEDPQAVAESNEAARAPEPASIEPERAPSAAEKAAADAKELLADMKPRLSEEEWRSLEDALSTIETEKGVGEQIVRDGAACLAAAVAA